MIKFIWSPLFDGRSVSPITVTFIVPTTILFSGNENLYFPPDYMLVRRCFRKLTVDYRIIAGFSPSPVLSLEITSITSKHSTRI